MSMELIAIISVMISASMALAGLILNGRNSLRRELQKQREETQGDFKSMREETQAEFKSMREETQVEFKSLREGIGDLRERMAHLEGLLDGLREAIAGRRVAETPANYDTR